MPDLEKNQIPTDPFQVPLGSLGVCSQGGEKAGSAGHLPHAGYSPDMSFMVGLFLSSVSYYIGSHIKLCTSKKQSQGENK